MRFRSSSSSKFSACVEISHLTLLLSLILCCIVTTTNTNAEPNINYQDGADVEVLVNTIGPYYNPSETYPFYRFPFCKPDKVNVFKGETTLGGRLEGDKLAKSVFDIKFKQPIQEGLLCKKQYTQTDLESLTNAIENYYYYNFLVAGIPVSNFVGYAKEITHSNTNEDQPHSLKLLDTSIGDGHNIVLFTSYQFTILYNQDKIIDVNLQVDEPKTLPVVKDNMFDNFDVTYTYSVNWVKTDVEWKERYKIRQSSSPTTIALHSFSILSSILTVILVTGFVILILKRIVKSDMMRYSRDVESGEGLQDDQGWKMIHGDVFRPPVYKNIFCALLGSGAQFLAISVSLLLMALSGSFNTHRHGYSKISGIVLFCLTSTINGYVSAVYYKQLGGGRWIRNIITASLIFVGPLFLVWCFVNSIDWYYSVTQALPFGTVVSIILIWMILGIPLTVLGGIIGKNKAAAFDSPTRVKVIPREIPKLSWYQKSSFYLLAGGFFPFFAIGVELHYVYLTIWGRYVYHLYYLLSLVFVLLVIVVACVSITLTYMILSSEDYRWWWSSIFNVGFTSVFVFFYSVLHFNNQKMSGAVQGAEFFGYSLLLCYAVFLTLGFIGFHSSKKFVHFIYTTVKFD